MQRGSDLQLSYSLQNLLFRPTISTPCPASKVYKKKRWTNSSHWSNNHAMASRGRTATEKLYYYTTRHARDRHEHNYDKACKKPTRAQLTTKSQFCLPLTELLPKSLLEVTPSSQVAHDLHFFVIIFVSYGRTVGTFTIRQPLSIQHDRLPFLIGTRRKQQNS